MTRNRRRKAEVRAHQAATDTPYMVARRQIRRCDACRDYADRGLPNYHHVHQVDELPTAQRADDQIIVHGYVVELSGRIDRCVVFFQDLEPALAFGRAGRMSSGDITSYGVYAAARELRYEEHRGDITTLHVTGTNLDRKPGEAAALQRWVAGVDPKSSHFQPPGHR